MIESSADTASPPSGYHMVNCYLSVGDVTGFIGFLERAFDGMASRQIVQPDGSIQHAEVRIGDSVLMIGPPLVDSLMTPERRHRPGTFYLFVADVDETCRRALAAGAQIIEWPTERFYGDRVAEIADVWGNRWWVATRESALPPNALQERAEEHWQARSHAVSRTVTRDELLDFLGEHKYGVEATVNAQGMPQAALVGFVVNDQLELFFDTFSSTRKVANLTRDRRISFVIGGQTTGDERTVQYEGFVDAPAGAELDAWKRAYFARHPDALRRSRLTGITYYRVRPSWIRYTNFNAAPAQVAVFDGAALHAGPRPQAATAVTAPEQQKTPWQPNVDRDAEFNSFANATRKD